MKIPYLVTLVGFLIGAASAAPLKSANLTRKVNDVRISENSRQARPANEGERIGGKSTVLTGRKSRAELTFSDKTITRIGANAAFSFSSGSRDMEIQQGSFLLQVPKGAGGATIRTATVTAAITGTTTMMEYSPGQWVKFICLEGTAKLRNGKGDTVEVPPGQMIAMHPDAAKFPRPVIVNIKRMVKTSALMDKDAFGGLDQTAEDAIEGTVAQQMGGKRDGTLLPGYLLDHGVLPKGSEGGGGSGNRSILSEISYQQSPGSGYNEYPGEYFETPPPTTNP